MAFALRQWGLDPKKYTLQEKARVFILCLGLAVLGFTAFLGIDFYNLIALSHHWHFVSLTATTNLWIWVTYLALLSIMITRGLLRVKDVGNLVPVALMATAFVTIVLSMTFDVAIQYFLRGYGNAGYEDWYVRNYSSHYVLGIVFVGVLILLRWRLNTYRFSAERDNRDTSLKHGSARLADKDYLKKAGMYRDNGAIIGDFAGVLRLATIGDRTIIGPRGTGKSTSVLIPALLTFNVPILAPDIKGELWAVTARYRAEVMGRKVYKFDPFGVTEDPAFHAGKPQHLLESVCINPLAYVPSDPVKREQYIISLSQALITRTSPHSSSNDEHFYNQAEIIIQGMIDMVLYDAAPHYPTLKDIHDQLIVDKDNIKKLMDRLLNHEFSRFARVAGSRLSQTTGDELSGTLSTIYHQFAWLRSEEIRYRFSKNTLPIQEFISGIADIFVIIPPSLLKSQSRMVRMIISMIIGQITQASPTALAPRYLFLLDELGQFGYCPDIETAYEVLRGYGVNIWSAFQTRGQIELYGKKADLFMEAEIKQFLGSDDVETMKWMQALAGRTTVVTESLSTSANTRQTHSKNYNFAETGVDLVHLNEIRELPADEQYVFIKGLRTIRCKKIFYFKSDLFTGRYDQNPLETRSGQYKDADFFH